MLASGSPVTPLSVSIGIAVTDAAHTDWIRPGALFSAADKALHLAKMLGGDRAVIADEPGAQAAIRAGHPAHPLKVRF